MRRYLLLWLVLGAVSVGIDAAAERPGQRGPEIEEEDGASAAEALVRSRYFEGIPYARARTLESAGVDRLAEMLRDPEESAHHVNVVMALGISGHPNAYAALANFYETPAQGEVEAPEYRARRSVPLAMGHLAHDDPRALDFLDALVEPARRGDPAATPRWRYRHLRGAKLAGILERAAITGLAMSGRSEAETLLRGLAVTASSDPAASSELRRHLGEAEALCDRVTREGPAAVFDRRSDR